MKRFLFPIIGFIFAFLLFSAIEADDAEAQGPCCGVPAHACDWWNPCPKPIPDRKKEVAKALLAQYEKSAMYFSFAALIYCGGGRYLGDDGRSAMGAACLASGAGVIAAKVGADQQRKIIADDPFDPEYQWPYGGRWLLYADLELDQIAPSDNGYVNNIAEHLQAIEFTTNFILVSFDRTVSCYTMMDPCGQWQRERIGYGFIWQGQRLDALAYNFWYLAEQLDGSDGELIDELREFAGWTYWAGGEYQQ
jgi:hypothetical protein